AIHFARWFHEVSGPDPIKLVGVHVLEQAHLQAALRYHHLEELETAATEAAALIVDGADAEHCLGKRHIVQGVHASKALAKSHETHGAEGTIVGRLAPRDSARIQRLGRTARRLLRQLPGPVLVVPPDYTPPAADAPVVVTTNLRQDSATAMHFGVEFAQRTGRKVVALHVIPEPDDYAAHYIPSESRAKIAAEHDRDAKLQMKKWLTGLGLEADHEEILAGNITETTLAYAKEKGAALLVSGSRRMSTVERFLLTSIGSELAANATSPVAVVPPMDADLVP
ncbi:MAG: universal stress protein, partial [Myxococcota bacterium]